MRRDWRRPCPPWWPDDQPWPPARPRSRWEGGRRGFLLRTGVFLMPALMFAAIGIARLLGSIAEGAGVPISRDVINFALFAIAVGAFMLFFGGMRRVGMPMGDIVEAANRVGNGDFSTKLIERGPPFLRSVARAFNTMTVRLQTQERQRRDLMADVAHELRTPLSIMRGRLEGLVDGVYPRDDRTLAQLVEETKHLERLVEDLRTLAHAEGGTLKLQLESTDLGVLLQEVVRSFEGNAQEAGVLLTGRSANELPLIDLDPVRIREVLANLIANAVRHTPRGGAVSVDAAIAADRVRVRVQDTGSGIPPDELAKIFERFSKGVDSTGSGLGLTIARNLVIAHGGEITAESQLGRGTTLTFALPLRGRGA